MANEPDPIDCTLEDPKALEQLLEWRDLQGLSIAVAAVASGVLMHLPAELEPQVSDLAKRESSCCSFLDISVVVADGELILEIVSDNPAALPVISALAGIAVP